MQKTITIEEEEEINQLSDGQYFGEYGVIEAQPRVASAYAMEDTHLFVIDRNTFNKSIGVIIILLEMYSKDGA
jgi:CRP-like cAMP-binding protein